MIRFTQRGMLGGALLIALVAAGTPALTQEADESESTENVLITVRIGKLEGGVRVPVKSYTLVVASGTVGSSLLSGQRVPFPATETDGDGANGIVYQNIGFSSEARAWILDNQRIRLVAAIEDSRVQAGTGGAPPSVETRQLQVSAILTDGVPLELTRVEGVTDQSGFVEVEARIMR